MLLEHARKIDHGQNGLDSFRREARCPLKQHEVPVACKWSSDLARTLQPRLVSGTQSGDVRLHLGPVDQHGVDVVNHRGRSVRLHLLFRRPGQAVTQHVVGNLLDVSAHDVGLVASRPPVPLVVGPEQTHSQVEQCSHRSHGDSSPAGEFVRWCQQVDLPPENRMRRRRDRQRRQGILNVAFIQRSSVQQ